MIVCLATAIFLAAVAALITRPVEPTWNGQRLTHWMAVLGSSNMDEEQRAFAAIEAIGTNGLPIIVRVLGARDSALQSRVLLLLQHVPLIHLRFAMPADRRRKAEMAFVLAGEESRRMGIPDIMRLSHDEDPGVRLTAVGILSHCFSINESAPLPALESAQLDLDPGVRAVAVEAVQFRRRVAAEVQTRRELWPNPQGGGNGNQPFPTVADRTSAAAGSGR
jgi:hypothetical protein